MIPCTDYALSGAKHFKYKDADGRTAQSQKLVSKTKEIIDYCSSGSYKLKFWQIENPGSRIHSLNPWMGKPILKFNPCDFAGYAPDPEMDRYNKKTWLWGDFVLPEQKRIEPLQKECPMWSKLGGGQKEQKSYEV